MGWPERTIIEVDDLASLQRVLDSERRKEIASRPPPSSEFALYQSAQTGGAGKRLTLDRHVLSVGVTGARVHLLRPVLAWCLTTYISKATDSTTRMPHALVLRRM